MRIDKLDEFQGLEAQMVRDWLTSKGCYRQDGPWRHPTEKYSYTDGEYGGLLWDNTLGMLSADFGFATVQALLREINPREREGVPSEAARIAHPGNWMVSGCLNPSGTKHFEVWSAQNLPLADSCPYNPDGKHIACWPLDQNGNKVRWPTDAEGKML